MDIMTKEQRSAIMRTIKSKDTKIEVTLRKALWRQGIRYRKNYKIFGCKPDIVITKYKIAIFCDGDFWHGNICNKERLLNSGSQYWKQKILRNQERDFENTINLRDNGWTVLRFWETEININLEQCVQIILNTINSRNI